MVLPYDPREKGFEVSDVEPAGPFVGWMSHGGKGSEGRGPGSVGMGEQGLGDGEERRPQDGAQEAPPGELSAEEESSM